MTSKVVLLADSAIDFIAAPVRAGCRAELIILMIITIIMLSLLLLLV